MAEKKKVNKKLLKVSIILYIVLIAVVGVYSLAWFVTNKRVEIGVNEQIQIAVGNNLEFAYIEDASLDPEWRSKVSIATDGEKNYPDITGGLVNGNLEFYYPTLLDDHDQIYSDSSLLQKLTGEEGYYIQLRLRFRTSVNMGIYLSSESFVNPVNTEKTDSTYGDISTDYMAGAVRIAFSEVTEQDENGAILAEELKNVWIPNDSFELYYEDVESVVDGKTIHVNKAFVKADGERERFYRDITDEEDPNYHNDAPYGYLGVVNNQITYNAYTEEDYYQKKVTVGTENLASQENGLPIINSAKELLTFTANDGNLIEKDLVVRIWFEGTDREADKALNGGNVNYNLKFIGIDKTKATTSEEMAETLVYNADGTLSFSINGENTPVETKDNVLYSFNGIDWDLYNVSGSVTAPLVNNTKNYVYVKIRESAAEKETSVYRLEKRA